MPPKVSILIPCWNAERTLSATLRSALNQTWPAIEVIAVDDGSTDGTLSILRSFEKEGVRVLTQPNQGAGPAKNRAFREASGDFIQYLDADDLLSPDKIEDQVRTLTETGCESEIAFCKWSHFTAEDLSDARFPEFSRYHDYGDPVALLCAMWTDNWMIPNHGWLISRRLAEQIGEWDEHVTEKRVFDDDFEYFTRALCATFQPVRYTSCARVYYRKGLSSTLTARPLTRDHLEAFLAGLIRREETLRRREDSPRTRSAAGALYYRFIYGYDGKADDLCRQARDRLQALGDPYPPRMGGPSVRLLMRLLGFSRTVALRRWLRNHLRVDNIKGRK